MKLACLLNSKKEKSKKYNFTCLVLDSKSWYRSELCTKEKKLLFVSQELKEDYMLPVKKHSKSSQPSSLGALCTYDDKTPLKDGVVFGDKLMVPIYGTAYSVKSGSVEYGPSFDNLAIFFVREVKRS